VQIVSVVWGLGIFFAILLVGIIISLLTLEMVSGVMYTRRVKVLEAWRLFMPHLKENAGQSALYILLLFVFNIGIVFVSLIAVFIVLLVMSIPFGGIFLIAMLIGKSAGLVWNTTTISIAVLYGTIFFSAFVYALSCVLQPVTVFLRSFSLAVLGQMDESFATVPTGIEPLSQDEQ
jgi:hypothetical protein